MQPQSGASPNPQYDFILNEQKQPPKSRFGFFQKLPKPAIIILGVGILFIAILLIIGLSGSDSSQPQPLIRAAGRAQEISRISGLVKSQSKDPDTQSLAATAEMVLSSEQSQLRRVGAISAEQAAVYQNKKTDEELAKAARENRLEEVYISYLRTNLNTYKTNLQSALEAAANNARTAIDSALKNVDTLLSSPQLD